MSAPPVFSKLEADRILKRVKKGKLADKLSVDLLAKVNKEAFENGGDGALVTIGKAMRKVFNPWAKTEQGQLRNYQSYYYGHYYGHYNSDYYNSPEETDRMAAAERPPAGVEQRGRPVAG